MPQQDLITRAVVMRRWLSIVLVAPMLLLLGCASGSSRRTSSIKAAKNVKSSATELSSRNQSLLGLYSAEIETAADRIIHESPSALARRQALEWKADAIPVLQQSLLNIDPVTAGLDTWTFLFQMAAYMQQPAVKQGFGASYPIVAETLQKMDAEIQQLVRVAAPSSNVDAIRQTVISWAESNPIQYSLAGRQSIDPERIRKLGESELGTMATIKALGESLGDLTARLDSYNAYLPRQARWQAELLLSDLAHGPELSAAASNFTALTNALAKTSNTMETLPELMGQAQKTVDTQRLAAQDFLREERLQVFNALGEERAALLAGVSRERQAATADLQTERQIVLQALDSERESAIRDVRAASDRALLDFDQKARGLINHFFVRALELMLLTLALGILATWLLLRRFGRRPSRGQVLYRRAA